MEENATAAMILSAIAGLATSIGAAATFFMRKTDVRLFALGMSFSAGVMIYISFMDILPMSIAQVAEGDSPLFGSGKLAHAFVLGMFFIGVASAALIDYFVPEHVESGDFDKTGRKKTMKAGLFTAIALAIHNFPEGISVFVSGVEDIKVGLFVAAAIAIHNIPEGVSVALPVFNSTGSRKKAFAMSTLSGMTEPLGAMVAYFFLMPYLGPSSMASVLAITAGIMVYISLDELLPMAKEYGEEHYGIAGDFL